MVIKKSVSFFLIIFFVFFLFTKEVSAFWIFSSKKNTNPSNQNNLINPPKTLSEVEKNAATVKYQFWEKSFEKKDVEEVIKNQNNFSLSVLEINYLFETEVKKIKNPSLTNVKLTLSEDNINVNVNFHKFVTGRFNFVAKVSSVENKVKLNLTAVKLYGFNIPAKWLEPKINKELDRYFSFMYQDGRYQGFDFINDGVGLQFKPKFSN